MWWRTRWLPWWPGDNLTWAFSHFRRSGDCWQSQKTCRWTWRTLPPLPCCLHVTEKRGKVKSKNTAVSPGSTLTLQIGGVVSVPRVLAIPVFTLSEKMWEILFSCSGFARTTIRMFHSVWIATCRWKNGIIQVFIYLLIKAFLPLHYSQNWRDLCFSLVLT